MTKEVSTVDGTAIFPAHELSPEEVVRDAVYKAMVLKRQVLDKQPSPIIIRGQRYPRYEDWQTLARFYNLMAKIEWSRALPEDQGYEARALVVDVRSGVEVSAAEAECLRRDEPKWFDKPAHQLRSMAQTRACAKALRNALAWVMVLAGVEATPAEEMSDEERTVRRPRAARPAGQPAVQQPAHIDPHGPVRESTLSDWSGHVTACLDVEELKELWAQIKAHVPQGSERAKLHAAITGRYNELMAAEASAGVASSIQGHEVSP